MVVDGGTKNVTKHPWSTEDPQFKSLQGIAADWNGLIKMKIQNPSSTSGQPLFAAIAGMDIEGESGLLFLWHKAKPGLQPFYTCSRRHPNNKFQSEQKEF